MVYVFYDVPTEKWLYLAAKFETQSTKTLKNVEFTEYLKAILTPWNTEWISSLLLSPLK